MTQFDTPIHQFCQERELSARPAFVSPCLGLLPMQVAMSVKPATGSRAAACLLAGIALAAALRRWLCGEARVAAADPAQPMALGRLDLHRPPLPSGQNDNVCGSRETPATTKSKRARHHQVWTSADGFTLSGARRA